MPKLQHSPALPIFGDVLGGWCCLEGAKAISVVSGCRWCLCCSLGDCFACDIGMPEVVGRRKYCSSNGFPRGLIFAFLSDNGVTEFRSSLCKSRGSQVTSSNHDLPTRLRLRYALQPCHGAVYVTFHWCCCDRFRGVTACASFVHDQPHDLPHINPSCPTTYARSGCARKRYYLNM